MDGQINKIPEDWKVKGNMAPRNVSSPTSTSVFTTHNVALAIGDEVMIDGIGFVPVRSVPSW